MNKSYWVYPGLGALLLGCALYCLHEITREPHSISIKTPNKNIPQKGRYLDHQSYTSDKHPSQTSAAALTPPQSDVSAILETARNELASLKAPTLPTQLGSSHNQFPEDPNSRREEIQKRAQLRTSLSILHEEGLTPAQREARAKNQLIQTLGHMLRGRRLSERIPQLASQAQELEQKINRLILDSNNLSYKDLKSRTDELQNQQMQLSQKAIESRSQSN